MRLDVPTLLRPCVRIAVLTLGLVGACHGRTEPLIAAVAAEGPAPHRAPASGPAAFVGRWALTTSDCSDQPWILTSNTLRASSVLSCTFEKADPTDAGYTADTMCTVGKAHLPGRLAFTLTGQGASRSLTVDGGPFAEPIGLIRCPDARSASLQSAATGEARGG